VLRVTLAQTSAFVLSRWPGAGTVPRKVAPEVSYLKRENPLPRPAARIEPDEHQCRPRGHQADAQRLASPARAAEDERDPHQDEASQAPKVEAGDDFRGKHCVQKLPRFRDDCPARAAIRALPDT